MKNFKSIIFPKLYASTSKNDIIKKIKNADIVSFDIFDTLLVRPCVFPQDVFYLMHNVIKEKYGLNFINMRNNIEAELNNAYCNIDEMYKYMGKKYNLADEVVEDIKKIEIEVEECLLTPRIDVKELYDIAVEKGKKIIAVSNMYLSSNILKSILKSKGYINIDEVIVSCEAKKRKSEVTLFEIVKNKFKNKNILHIGDNYKSDYKCALNANIDAIYYPSVINILKTNSTISKIIKILKKNNNLSFNIYFGFILNNFYFENYKNNDFNLFNNIIKFTNMFLAQYLVYIILNIRQNNFIQEKYDNLFFVSRDGYLPKKIYDILNYDNKYLPSTYLYASRKSYCTGLYNSYSEILKKYINKKRYTLRNFINAYIASKEFKNFLFSKLNNDVLDYKINKNYKKCINILSETNEKFYFNEQYKLAQEYFTKMFSGVKKDRILIFDIGYGGSISNALSSYITKKIDKVYLFEDYQNFELDKINNTYTFLINKSYDNFLASKFCIAFEELFSPLEGSCIGYEKIQQSVLPIVESSNFSEEMKMIYDNICDTSCKFTKTFIEVFKKYNQYLYLTNMDLLFKILFDDFHRNKTHHKLFNKIIFNDGIFYTKNKSLSKKIKLKK